MVGKDRYSGTEEWICSYETSPLLCPIKGTSSGRYYMARLKYERGRGGFWECLGLERG